jgi:mRNA deadenylase 3'-5' endonuclease subunit Ccr4
VSFTLASYNVLADSYIKLEYYPRTPREHLDPAWRRPALVEHVAHLDPDILCLQEVERATFEAIRARLSTHTGEYAPKLGRKPDGCALFFRKGAFELVSWEKRPYRDETGHVALLAKLTHAGRALLVVTTHLRWEPPGKPGHVGLAQARELVRGVEPGPTIVCGDLNATPESDVIQVFKEAGFRETFSDTACTANPNAHAKKIDYILHTRELTADPLALRTIDDMTPLPCPEEPSDHLAIMGRFELL